MNVVILEAGSPGGPTEVMAREKPGLYAVKPGQAAMRAMEAALELHSNPRPVVDYRGISLPDGTIEIFREEADKAPAEMPALQAEIHARLAAEIKGRLEQAQVMSQVVGLELPFAETA